MKGMADRSQYSYYNDSRMNKAYSVQGGMVEIEDLAYAGSDAESLFIPDTVRSIGKYAFMNCYSLREIRMPERVDRIGAGLFQNCWQLRSVRLPEGTETLGTDMFENCHALAELWIPSSLKEAARTSLSGCRSLRAIHISPQQLLILPASARYTAALTFMEEHARENAVYRTAPDDAADETGTNPNTGIDETGAASDTGADDSSVNRNAAASGYRIINDYVRERQKSILDLAVNRRSTGAVSYMLEHGLISEDTLRLYINKAAAGGRVEITALLLDGTRDKQRDNALNEDPFI